MNFRTGNFSPTDLPDGGAGRFASPSLQGPKTEFLRFPDGKIPNILTGFYGIDRAVGNEKKHAEMASLLGNTRIKTDMLKAQLTPEHISSESIKKIIVSNPLFLAKIEREPVEIVPKIPDAYVAISKAQKLVSPNIQVTENASFSFQSGLLSALSPESLIYRTAGAIFEKGGNPLAITKSGDMRSVSGNFTVNI